MTSEDIITERQNEVNKLLTILEKDYPVVKDVQEIMRIIQKLHNIFMNKSEQFDNMKKLEFKLSQLQRKINGD